MDGQARQIVVLSLVLVGAALHLRLAASQEVEDEREFNYEQGDEHGPGRWGLLHKEWEACGKGRLQSPIDLADEKVTVQHRPCAMPTSYRPSRATVVNRGHDIMLRWEGDGAGELWLNGTGYALNQLHWHSPSEHTVNGNRFDLELHMVHQAADGRIAVVGVLYRVGRPDPFLAEMEERILAVRNRKDHEADAGAVDPRHVRMRAATKYYRYLGSLTTPPCTEGVAWTILNHMGTASREQLEMLREAVMDGHENNARPGQSFNDRVLKYYQPLRKGN